MKKNLLLFALLFAQDAKGLRYYDACRSDHGTQEHPDRRAQEVCGWKPRKCTSDGIDPCNSALRLERKTYPNCAALEADGARFEHFGACRDLPPRPRSHDIVASFRFFGYEECLAKTEKIDEIPALLVPWREPGEHGDYAPGREAYCRRLFPQLAPVPGPRTDTNDGASPPPAAPSHAAPPSPGYPGGILPDGTVYR